MMLSMTGFGTGTRESDDFCVAVEIKSVNQRFLDTNFYLPKSLFTAEINLRQLVKKYIARGKIEVRAVVTDKRENDLTVRVDQNLALCYSQALNELSALLKMPRTNDVTKIAAFDGVLSVEQPTNTTANGAEELLTAATEDALTALVKMREKEGATLREDFRQRIATLQNTVDTKLAVLKNEIVTAYRERIEKKLAELTPTDVEPIDPARIVQEVALYADRTDFTEEIVRLKSHLAQFAAILDSTQDDTEEKYEPVGRKLDFLLQEINREVNTIGSKANNVTAAQICVTLKSEIEKIREQVQNIE